MTAKDVVEESKQRELARVKIRWRLLRDDLQTLVDFGPLAESMTLREVIDILKEGPKDERTS